MKLFKIFKNKQYEKKSDETNINNNRIIDVPKQTNATEDIASDHKQKDINYSHNNQIIASPSVEESEKDEILTESAPITKAAAIIELRKDIIRQASETKTLSYRIASFLFEDAKKISDKCDGIFITLNLVTKKLNIEYSSYPNQFGYSRGYTNDLSAENFNKFAVDHNMSDRIKLIETQEDWDAVLNEDIDNLIKSITAYNKRKEEAAFITAQKKHSIIIPDGFNNIKPNMLIRKLYINLSQRFGSSSVSVSCEDGQYILEAYYGKSYKRILSPGEASWLENELDKLIDNQDTTPWSSLAGFDRMTAHIDRIDGLKIKIIDEKPIKKYIDLMDILSKLAQYASNNQSNR